MLCSIHLPREFLGADFSLTLGGERGAQKKCFPPGRNPCHHTPLWAHRCVLVLVLPLCHWVTLGNTPLFSGHPFTPCKVIQQAFGTAWEKSCECADDGAVNLSSMQTTRSSKGHCGDLTRACCNQVGQLPLSSERVCQVGTWAQYWQISWLFSR